MKLFPAIDLRDGKVVRLHKGDFAAETVYGDDPASVARSFVEQGAEWVHCVDLDAAKTGTAHNRELVRAIVEAAGVPVQSGGGVRDEATADALLATGVARIVMGTAAIERPELVEKLAVAHPGKVAVGLDARSGMVAGHGWTEGSGLSVQDLVARFEDAGVAAFVITDIDRDGTLGGPDVGGLAAVLARTQVDVVASGGIGVLDDLAVLAGVERDGRRLAGAIVGKALYEGRFTVAEAVGVCR